MRTASRRKRRIDCFVRENARDDAGNNDGAVVASATSPCGPSGGELIKRISSACGSREQPPEKVQDRQEDEANHAGGSACGRNGQISVHCFTPVTARNAARASQTTRGLAAGNQGHATGPSGEDFPEIRNADPKKANYNEPISAGLNSRPTKQCRGIDGE
jgi:hypothetical protein